MNIGFACFGRTCAFACSSLTNFIYSFTFDEVAGLLLTKCRSLPTSSNIFINRCTNPSTDPAESRDGHEHVVFPVEPISEQFNVWTTVFPLLSFHTRNFRTSSGVQLLIVGL